MQVRPIVVASGPKRTKFQIYWLAVTQHILNRQSFKMKKLLYWIWLKKQLATTLCDGNAYTHKETLKVWNYDAFNCSGCPKGTSAWGGLALSLASLLPKLYFPPKYLPTNSLQDPCLRATGTNQIIAFSIDIQAGILLVPLCPDLPAVLYLSCEDTCPAWEKQYPISGAGSMIRLESCCLQARIVKM